MRPRLSKQDQILEELKGLAAVVSRLENRVTQLETQPPGHQPQAAAAAATAPSPTAGGGYARPGVLNRAGMPMAAPVAGSPAAGAPGAGTDPVLQLAAALRDAVRRPADDLNSLGELDDFEGIENARMAKGSAAVVHEVAALGHQGGRITTAFVHKI